MIHPIRIGVVGCGNISDIYIQNLQALPGIEVAACSARTLAHAEKTAQKYHIAKAVDTDTLIADPDIDVVLNITTPKSHYDICRRALEAGKHVYAEKPLSIELEEGEALVALAKEKNLRLGCAPDTFLGGGLQTCRKLIDDGVIGHPIAATAFLGWHGPEGEHPNPAFLYQYGAGPIFDYGPYYLTALVQMLGPAKMVCGIAGKGYETRTVTCPGPNKGTTFPVEVPTHVTGSIQFESGAIATILTSFDMWGHSLPHIEIYGTEGTLRVPDPDKFGGPVYLLKAGETEFTEVPLSFGHTENSRGIGLADMLTCMQEGTPHRANGETALHVLEIMRAFTESWERKEYITLHTTCTRADVMEG